MLPKIRPLMNLDLLHMLGHKLPSLPLRAIARSFKNNLKLSITKLLGESTR